MRQLWQSKLWHSLTPSLRNWRIALFMLVTVAVALVVASCQPRAATPPAPLAPYRPSEPPASSPGSSAATQPASPVPAATAAEANRPIVIQFAKASTALDKDWEGFRRSYEEWRRKSTCAEPAITASLSGFIAGFQKIKSNLSELPRASLTREAAERLVEAAEKEEAALTELRAKWKPGDESIFQKYESDRLAADRLRRQAAQSLNDLVVASQAENMQAIDKYRQALRVIERDWDALRKAYDSWRQSLSTEEKDKEKVKEKEKAAAGTLQKLATDAQDILSRLYALIPPVSIQKPADLVAQAAEKEEAALRKLNAAWKPGDNDSLAAYERERLAVNKLRRESALGVEAVTALGLKENKALLGQFSTLMGQVDKSWNDFRSQYDAWRNKGGDCDRDGFRQQISISLSSFHALAQRTYALPQSAVVRPLAELLNQAAEREEVALRQLRDNWKPYDSTVYQPYEKEGVAIDRLRRQATAGLTDLLQKNNISAAEVAP